MAWRKRRRRRKPQVTCWCGAYEFPHRITGGKCSGAAWADYYFIYVKEECELCNCNYGGGCDVADGREEISNCDGFEDYFKRGLRDRYPQSSEEWENEMEQMYQDYYYDGREEC